MFSAPVDSYISLVNEMTNRQLSRTVEVLKALAHPSRLRIVAMLSSGELCVCQLTAVLGHAVSTVSAHLTELRRAGLVTESKEGRFVSYRLAPRRETKVLLQQVRALAASDAQLEADAALVRGLRTVGAEKLCRVELDLSRLGLKRASAREGATP
jgi:DNA-binding transcriptional ArsR family regulator